MRQASTTSIKHVKKGIVVPAAATAPASCRHTNSAAAAASAQAAAARHSGLRRGGGGQQGVVGRSNLQQGSDSHQFIIRYKCSKVSLHFCEDCRIFCEGENDDGDVVVEQRSEVVAFKFK